MLMTTASIFACSLMRMRRSTSAVYITSTRLAASQCINAVYCYTRSVVCVLCVFYCLLVTSVSPANSAEPIERVVLFYAGTADWQLMACGALYIGHSPRAVVIINVRWSAGQGRARSHWSSRVRDVRAALLSRRHTGVQASAVPASRHILARPDRDAVLECGLVRLTEPCVRLGPLSPQEGVWMKDDGITGQMTEQSWSAGLRWDSWQKRQEDSWSNTRQLT